MTLKSGLAAEERKRIADGLADLLADSYTLYLKTHGYHWNVTGPLFGTLHLMFEQQYTELALAVDEIAERIRALGAFAPASYAAMQARASIAEEKEGAPSAEDMIRRLADDQDTVVRTARAVSRIAAAADDEPTVDLLTRRMQIHEKNAWMLRSLLAA